MVKSLLGLIVYKIINRGEGALNGSTAIAIIVIAILLASIAIYTVMSPAEEGGVQATYSIKTNFEETPNQTLTETATTTSINEPVKLEGVLNINLKRGENIIRISKYHMTITSKNSTITIDMVLPNPCYKVNLRYEESNATLLLLIESPPEGTMCIQVVKPMSVSTTITPPPSGEVTLKVYVDQQFATVATIPVTP